MRDIKVTLKQDGTVKCSPPKLLIGKRAKNIEWYKDTSGEPLMFTKHQGLPNPPFDPPQISADSVTVQYQGGSQSGDWGYTISVTPVKKKASGPGILGDGSGTIRNH
jgi:hypothetical protein